MSLVLKDPDRCEPRSGSNKELPIHGLAETGKKQTKQKAVQALESNKTISF